MAEFGAEEIWHQLRNIVEEFGTEFPDWRTTRVDRGWGLSFPMGLWLVPMGLWLVPMGLWLVAVVSWRLPDGWLQSFAGGPLRRPHVACQRVPVEGLNIRHQTLRFATRIPPIKGGGGGYVALTPALDLTPPLRGDCACSTCCLFRIPPPPLVMARVHCDDLRQR